MSTTNPVTTLTGNGKTDAFDLRTCASPVCFTLEGGQGGTVTPQYANREGAKVDSDWTSDPTPIPVGANAGPYQIPLGLAKFIRFVGGGVSGTVTVRWARAKDDHGNMCDVNIEAPVAPPPYL